MAGSMQQLRQARGIAGEQQAAQYLQAKGYAILARRFRSRHGEIDLVCRDGRWLVFVEVRARSSSRYGMPEESLTPAKGRRLYWTAHHFRKLHRLEHLPYRFDLVAVARQANGRPAISHYRFVAVAGA